MPTEFPLETILNIVFFLIGLAVGFIQLWQSQRYFIADQQSKFEQITKSTTDIMQRLAVIEGVTNRLIDMDRAMSNMSTMSNLFQDRLFGIVERGLSTTDQAGQATAATTDRIKALITQEFASSGIATSERMSALEEKLDRILSSFSDRMLQLSPTSLVPIHISGALGEKENRATPNQTVRNDQQKTQLFLDRTKKVFTLNGVELRLTNSEFSLLSFLYRNIDQVVSLSEIAQILAEDGILNLSGSAVATLVHRLRRKLSLASDKLRITSMRGLGYMLTDSVVETG